MLPTQYGSFMKRFVAHVIDVLIASLIAGAIVIPLGVLTVGAGELINFALLKDYHFGPYFDPENFIRTILSTLPMGMIFFWVMVHAVLYWFYFAVFESSPRQATPGKMMFDLFVTDTHGRRISFPRALARTVAKVLSKAIIYIGYLLALFTPRSQALHDLIAGTLVLEPAMAGPDIAAAPPQAEPPSPTKPPENRSGEQVKAPPEEYGDAGREVQSGERTDIPPEDKRQLHAAPGAVPPADMAESDKVGPAESEAREREKEEAEENERSETENDERDEQSGDSQSDEEEKQR